MACAVLVGGVRHVVRPVEVEIVEHGAASEILLFHMKGQDPGKFKGSLGDLDAVGVGVAAVLIVLFHFLKFGIPQHLIKRFPISFLVDHACLLWCKTLL